MLEKIVGMNDLEADGIPDNLGSYRPGKNDYSGVAETFTYNVCKELQHKMETAAVTLHREDA